jgi:hypothetical protein
MSLSKTCFSMALAALPLALLPFAPACNGSGGSTGPEGGPVVVSPAVFVIDSTGKMFSFDAKGNSLGSVPVTSPIGFLNGGGITVGPNDWVYVTSGQPTNSVSAYSLSLVPQSSLAGSFASLNVPRGIAFDPGSSLFYVGNGAAGVNVYDAMGEPVTMPGAFPSTYGPSGVAYDPDDHTLWVADYVEAMPANPPRYGVAEFTESGAVAQTFDYAKQFQPLDGALEPYAITVCPAAATGGTGGPNSTAGATLVWSASTTSRRRRWRASRFKPIRRAVHPSACRWPVTSLASTESRATRTATSTSPT